jgi:hypothetical protein
MGGKPPDVVIEIVSDRRGGEEDDKLRMYARLGVLFYIIYDPRQVLGGDVLRALALQRGKYEVIDPGWFPEVGLGVTLWRGTFEAQVETWLRWCDQRGRVIPTGAERADEERRRADEERRRADQERQRADEERNRANEERQRADEERRRADTATERMKLLEARLRELGGDPDV